MAEGVFLGQYRLDWVCEDSGVVIEIASNEFVKTNIFGIIV